MRQITSNELADWIGDPDRKDPVLIDVREPWEYELCHIGGSVHMPMGSVPARLSELDAEGDIVLICHHGSRSAQVGMFLEHQGFRNIINLARGVAGWAAQVDAGMPQY